MSWMTNKTLKRNWFGSNPHVSLSLVLGWLASLSTFFLSLMVGWFFDLNYQEGVSKSALLEKFGLKIETMEVFFLIMGIVILLKFALQLTERSGINRAADLFIYQITGRLYRKQINWSPEIFEERSFGKYLLRYSGDMTSIRGMLINGIHRGIRDGLFLVSGIGVLLWINFGWTIWLLSIALVCIPVFLFLDKKQLETVPEKRSSKNELLNYVTSSFSKHRQIFEKGNSEYNFRGFRRRNKRVLTAANKYQKWESLRHSLINVTGPILVAFLLAILHTSPHPGSPGELLTFLLVLAALIPAFRSIVKAPNLIQKGLISLNKIEKLTNKRSISKLKSDADEKIIPIPKPQQAIKP